MSFYAEPIRGEWSNFEPCTKSCGVGWLIRKRICLNFSPQLQNKNCSGLSTDAYPCNTQDCPPPIGKCLARIKLGSSGCLSHSLEPMTPYKNAHLFLDPSLDSSIGSTFAWYLRGHGFTSWQGRGFFQEKSEFEC